MFVRRFLKICFYILLSISFFYFFEVPFLVETAFAEEVSSEVGEKTEGQEELKKEETWASSIKKFLYNHRWQLLVAVGVTVSAFCVFWVFTFTGDGGAGLAAAEGGSLHSSYVPTMQERLEVFANHPDLPRSVVFFEDITNYKEIFIQVPQEMPNKFTAGAHIYKDATLQNVLAVVPEFKHPLTGNYTGPLYTVYNARPLFHADINPVFSNVGDLSSSRVLVNYNTVIAALQDPAYVAPKLEFINNATGWSNDPSLPSLIKKGFQEFGLLDFHFNQNMTQDIVLSYQKVVLVDPSTLHYNYYHKFAIHPLDTEAMSTYLETHFDGKIIKAFYLKDLEVLQFTNTYSVEHPDDIIYRATGVYPDEPAWPKKVEPADIPL